MTKWLFLDKMFQFIHEIRYSYLSCTCNYHLSATKQPMSPNASS